jgi:hypothetical protein
MPTLFSTSWERPHRNAKCQLIVRSGRKHCSGHWVIIEHPIPEGLLGNAEVRGNEGAVRATGTGKGGRRAKGVHLNLVCAEHTTYNALRCAELGEGASKRVARKGDVACMAGDAPGVVVDDRGTMNSQTNFQGLATTGVTTTSGQDTRATGQASCCGRACVATLCASQRNLRAETGIGSSLQSRRAPAATRMADLL